MSDKKRRQQSALNIYQKRGLKLGLAAAKGNAMTSKSLFLERVYVFVFFALVIGLPAALFLWLLIWHTAWIGVIAFVLVCFAIAVGISVARGY